MTSSPEADRARVGLRCAVLALLLAVAALWGAAGPASAHASLLSSTPADGDSLATAPVQVELVFDEPVAPIDGDTRLLMDGAEPVVLSASSVDTTVLVTLPDLTDGAYVLAYRVVSQDGHPISGAVRFGVGDAAPEVASPAAESAPASTDRAAWALGALQYLGLLLTFGTIAFGIVALRTAPDTITARLVQGSWAVAIGASLLLVPISALRAAGLGLAQLFSPTSWWPVLSAVWQPLLVAGVVLLAGGAAVVVVGRGMLRAAAPLALLAVASPVLVGHSQTVAPVLLTQVTDVVHLVAAAVWLGGLVGLSRVLTGRTAAGSDAQAAVVVLRRFSALAALALVLVAVSGVLLAVLVLGSVQALITTTYGHTLLVKVAMVAVVAGIAGWNRSRLLPLITAAGPRTPWARLRRIVRQETALLVVVVLVTGSLTLLSPTHDHGEGGGTAEQDAVELATSSQGLGVDGVLEPARTGAVTFTFTLTYDGAPVSPEDVTVRATLPEADLGPLDAEVVRQDDGSYTAVLDLPLSGAWQVVVGARVSTYDRPRALLEVTIS